MKTTQKFLICGAFRHCWRIAQKKSGSNNEQSRESNNDTTDISNAYRRDARDYDDAPKTTRAPMAVHQTTSRGKGKAGKDGDAKGVGNAWSHKEGRLGRFQRRRQVEFSGTELEIWARRAHSRRMDVFEKEEEEEVGGAWLVARFQEARDGWR